MTAALTRSFHKSFTQAAAPAMPSKPLTKLCGVDILPQSRWTGVEKVFEAGGEFICRLQAAKIAH